MTTSQFNPTLKRVKHSIRKFLSKSLSKLSPPKAESNTPGRQDRGSLFEAFGISRPSRTKAIHAFGILGITGPLCTPESGCMTTDLAAWQFLISHMKGYKSERSIWLTIRPINHLFPDGSVIFGEAGCDRLRLPLPMTPETDLDPEISASRFALRCLNSLGKIARKVKPREMLVLLLIGHGDIVHGEFQFLITTQPDKVAGEAYITKDQLEEVLEPCRGDILIICNSCRSGHLASERWTLLCAATSEQDAESLSPSYSSHFRESIFTACAVAQVAREHGLKVPLPRTDPEKRRAALPTSPPRHSFSGPISEITSIKPSDVSFTDFVGRMISMKEFLVENSINIFQVGGPKSMVSWTSIFPVDFTAEVVSRISIKADSHDYVTNYNETFSIQGPQVPSLTSQSRQMDPLLIKLASAMPDNINRYALRNLDGAYMKAGEDLQRHIAEPERYPSPFGTGIVGEETMLIVLHSKNIQAVAVQFIAKELGWCKGADEAMTFIPHQLTHWDLGEMLENGIKVDKLPLYLQEHHFPELTKPSIDRACAQWLWDQWDGAGKPAISGSVWEKVVEKVGVMTEREVIR